MRKKIIVFLMVTVAVFAAAFLIGIRHISKNGNGSAGQDHVSNKNSVLDFENAENEGIPSSAKEENIPLSRAGERVTKKPFGILITRENSPVQPEKFEGYHAGTDYEIFPGEENVDVPVRAVCLGKLRLKQFVSGYGGIAVQDCQIGGEFVTVLYGHLSLASIEKKVGDEILEAEIIGNLGDPARGETDGERKHLHLGIHKGAEVNFLGYVSSQNELAGWIDPCLYFCSPPHQN